MAKITIHKETTKTPITMIGKMAGVCYNADTSDDEKNYIRGKNCLRSGHGRAFEFPDVYMTIDEISAKFAREWYTHIGGAPTRLQESTRYVDYTKQDNFKFITPMSIIVKEEKDGQSPLEIYDNCMATIRSSVERLQYLGIPKEDASMLLPLGMETKIICKHNLRNLIDMSHQRLCSRAFWEYRQVFNILMEELSYYSPEWLYIVKNYFQPKCELTGFCEEHNSCGRFPKKTS